MYRLYLTLSREENNTEKHWSISHIFGVTDTDAESIFINTVESQGSQEIFFQGMSDKYYFNICAN